MAESRYWRARAISLGLPPDADPADVMLVQGGEMGGIEPARKVVDEYNRTARVLQAELAKEQRKEADAAS